MTRVERCGKWLSKSKALERFIKILQCDTHYLTDISVFFGNFHKAMLCFMISTKTILET